MAAPIRRKFVPGRMLGGLGLVAGGLGGLYAMFFTDLLDGRISIKLILLFGILILGGFGFAASAFARACARCDRELKEGALFTPAEWQQHLAQVAMSGHSGALLSLAQVPLAQSQSNARGALSFHFCPQCLEVAQIHASTQTVTGSDRTTWKDVPLTAPTTFVGPEVGQLVAFARARGGVPD